MKWVEPQHSWVSYSLDYYRAHSNLSTFLITTRKASCRVSRQQFMAWSEEEKNPIFIKKNPFFSFLFFFSLPVFFSSSVIDLPTSEFLLPGRKKVHHPLDGGPSVFTLQLGSNERATEPSFGMKPILEFSPILSHFAKTNSKIFYLYSPRDINHCVM